MKKIIAFASVLLLVSASAWASDKIRVATTTSTFAGIAGEIAGDRAEIYYVASPKQDVHFITPTPKDVLKVRRADVFIHGGMDLELWRDPLLNAAGRREFMGDHAERAIDVSHGIAFKEIPQGTLSRIHGDVHAFGNPHYWMDPENARIIAKNIEEGLANLYPADAEFFAANLKTFDQKIRIKLENWQARLAPFQGSNIVTYHNAWPYFTDRFGLTTAAFLEPKPGIPPTPKHLHEVMRIMRDRNVRVVVKQIFQEGRSPKKMAAETDAEVLTLAQESGETGGSYTDMIENNVRLLEQAFKSKNPA